ncbi:MAG: proline dehydrogenase family protein [Thermaerobacter sp.]|nr:proline dehydrogenase family protein [Thermaerobacter sp.]
MFRELILTVADNPLVSSTVKRYGLHMGAGRFVAGEHLTDAVAVTRQLQQEGIGVTLDHLGEGVRDAASAEGACQSYLDLLEALDREHLPGNVSVKLTMMGLAVDRALGLENTRRVVERAAAMQGPDGPRGFVRIDMEDTPYTIDTIDVYRRLADEWSSDRVGLVLQAYLYRSRDDLAALSDRPRRLRLVKGAYSEPAELAYPSKADVDANYVRLVEQAVEAGHHVAVATHDEAIIRDVLQYFQRVRLPRDRYEFQMLYGIKLSVLRELARAGHATRVYVPYGEDWYAYFSRRLAERPANILFFGRALLRR